MKELVNVVFAQTDDAPGTTTSAPSTRHPTLRRPLPGSDAVRVTVLLPFAAAPCETAMLGAVVSVFGSVTEQLASSMFGIPSLSASPNGEPSPQAKLTIPSLLLSPSTTKCVVATSLRPVPSVAVSVAV